ncbi:MAG TPA: ribosome biogenesis GTPase Der [Patescibacteria group bacterium]|nr:ribosome biogenesis GTPase Der [Patescibacteria group bacterium]
MTGPGSLPVVAIVGRPNVGKSTLFNRVVGDGRAAIVEDRARTTRDRIYGEGEWNGRRYLAVDTGGLEAAPGDAIEERVQEQARLAIAEADVIVFVVDATAGLTPADQEAAETLRRATAPVFVAVNKADNAKRELDAAEFWALGWDETWPISAAHGRGVADLLDEIVAVLPPESDSEVARKAREAATEREVDLIADELAEGLEPDAGVLDDGAPPGPVTIALVGRPNVGKSSLLNALLGEERAIVSEIPGTTRDAFDTRLAYGQGEVVLVDTAGIRRPGKVGSGPAAERYSTLRALKAIDRADITILVIDAVEGLTAQDAHVAGYAIDAGKGLVIALNKWDLVEGKTDRTFDQYVAWIRRDAPFLAFAPIVSISAKSGQRVERVLEMAVDVWGERRKRIGTGELNRLLAEATARQVPPVARNRRPRLYYATQAAIEPPTFIFFANDAELIHFSYRRYLENRIRDVLGFHGAPIRLVFRNRGAERPRRKHATRRGGGARSGSAQPGSTRRR